MADATIHLPALGNVKKTYVYAGAGVVVVGVGFWWWHQRSAANAAAAAAATSTDDTTTDSAPIDTATGYPTGSAQDLAALAEQNAAIGTDDGAGLDTSDDGGGGGNLISSEPTAGGYSSNGAWAQGVETYMTETAGADPTTVAAALGKYISGQDMTQDQISVAQQAIAFQGYPPVSGSDGYPPSMRTTPVTTTPTPTAPKIPPAPANMRLLESSPTTIDVGWNTAVGGASIYHVYRAGVQQATVYGTFYQATGLKPGTKYGPFTVKAANAAGQLSPASNGVTVTTPKK